jgi:uncharacterized protein (TIGR03437 family)
MQVYQRFCSTALQAAPHRLKACATGLLLVSSLSLQAQVSKSAYRGLGQPDLRQNGVNMVQGVEMYNPAGVALDARDGVIHLYVSDSRNHRVLAWQDVRSFQNGDAPALVLGQSSPQSSTPLGIGVKGFNVPFGMAVDPMTGNLYVADTGNNRVLRFPAPFANQSRVEPDAVYGQPNFGTNTANPGGASRASMNAPRGVGFDSQGNLWVADTGNHRVLRFNAAILDGLNPEADLVVGQHDFSSNSANRGGGGVNASGFDTPVGVAFDPQNNLYVSDFNNTRVLKFSAPLGGDASATAVFGQSSFTARGVPAQASATTLAGPIGLCVDLFGNLYVAVPRDNRVLVFASSGGIGASARDLFGQVDFTATQANPSSFPYASDSAFSAVNDVKLDADGNLIFADTGNNRVLVFPRGSKSATRVLGQVDFRANGANRIKPGSINSPYKIAIDYSQAPFALYVSDTNNHRILGWRDAVRFRTGDPADLVIGQPDFDTALANIDTRGSPNPSRTSLASPKGIALDSGGNLYVADSGNNRVLRYPRPTAQFGRISPDLVLGQVNFTSSISAAVSASSLNGPTGVALDPDGNLFVADASNNRVLEFASGASNNAAAIRVFGQPGLNTGVPSNIASAQTLSLPQGIYVDASYSLYVADSGANRVLIFPNTRDAAQSGTAAAIVLGQDRFDSAGTAGGASGLRIPWDVVLDSSGNIYISDAGNNRVMVYPSLLFLPLSGAAAIAVVGQQAFTGTGANFNATGGLATPEGLVSPLGLFVDRRDTLYVGDAGNNRVLHFLKPSSIAHSANAQAGAPLARGGMASFFGTGLADSEEKSGSGSLPRALAGREIAVNDDTVAPLFSVTASQIDFQVPSAAPLGTTRIAVRVNETGELVAGSLVPVTSTSPGLFLNEDAAKSQGRITNQDGSMNSPSNAALRGSTIKIFGTGQGPVSPPVPDGEVAPSDISTIAVATSDGSTCLSRQPSVCVAIGSTFGEVQFSGLAPQMVGVWLLTVKIPANANTGNVALRAVINGTPTNLVNVSIK